MRSSTPAKLRDGLLMAYFFRTAPAKGLGAGGLSLLPQTVTRAGYFNLTGNQRIWAQYSVYVAYADTPGLLAEQSVFVRTERLSPLSDDITQLADALHTAFNQRMLLPHSSMERRDGAN